MCETSFFSRLFGRAPTVSLINLHGPIAASGMLNRRLDAASVEPLIERAFKAPRLAAVALSVNSPGGSPVQSALIAGRIREMADKENVPVLAFCEDVAASGGYWLACAADEIFVDPNSIVGSIGVVSASFGFDKAIDKLGIERHVATAGENKWRLDPFLPRKTEDEAWLAELQQKMHRSFIAYVRERRGAKLASAPAEVFSGEAFLGVDAVELGLVDGLGRMRPVLEQRFGDEVKIAPTAQKRSLISRLLGSAQHRGVDPALDAEAVAAGLARGLLDEADHRAMMARYGL
ncbi:MAG: S49 family peptidase [Neomegalonema sp.]|nr:S49 family peptidase [Neomegalonema sp.]